MRMGPIFVLLACAGLSGWFAPELRGGARPNAPSPGGGFSAAPASKPASGWGSGPTVLQRSSDGHFYADASIDSQTVHFLVDTGASAVALTGDDARSLGLAWSNSDLIPIGKGASGTVYGVPVKLGMVELGETSARDVSGVIVPEGLSVSLLGQSFLARVKDVRIEGDRMELGYE